jgi:hypothetical protein
MRARICQTSHLIGSTQNRRKRVRVRVHVRVRVIVTGSDGGHQPIHPESELDSDCDCDPDPDTDADTETRDTPRLHEGLAARKAREETVADSSGKTYISIRGNEPGTTLVVAPGKNHESRFFGPQIRRQ